MSIISEIVSYCVQYIKEETGTALALLLILSLGIGALVNLPNITYISGKAKEKSRSNQAVLFRKLIDIPSSSFFRDKEMDEEKTQRKKKQVRRQLSDVSSSMARRKPREQNDDGSHLKTRFMSLLLWFRPWTRFFAVIMIPILFFSSIPAVYPIYKHFIAPSLPTPVQLLFTDLKSFFVAIFGLILSGSQFNGTSPIKIEYLTNSTRQPVILSLEDLVYSYLGHCNIYSQAMSMQALCFSCTCPAISTWIRTGFDEICQDCDICRIDSIIRDTPSVSFFDDDGCSMIINDVVQIVRVSKDNDNAHTLTRIFNDCFSTFILYIRFNFHIISRFFIRFGSSCIHGIHHCLRVYQWIIQEILTNYHSNQTHSIALFVLLVTFIIITLITLIIITKIIRIFLSMIHSTFSPPLSLSSSLTMNTQSSNTTPTLLPEQRNHLQKPSNQLQKNEKLHKQQIPSRPHTTERQTPLITSSYDSVMSSNEWISLSSEYIEVALMINMCRSSNESLDSLLRLLEDLHAENLLSTSVIQNVRSIHSTIIDSSLTMRSILSPIPAVSTGVGQNPFTPLASELMTTPQTPIMYSYSMEQSAQKRARNSLMSPPSVFSRPNRQSFFRQSSLSSKSLSVRNSLGSEKVGRSGSGEKDVFEEDVENIL